MIDFSLYEKDGVVPHHVAQGTLDEVQKELVVLREQCAVLSKIVHHTYAEQLPGMYFITGESGEKDSMNLPKFLFVCPSFGLDGFATYKKYSEYSSPEW